MANSPLIAALAMLAVIRRERQDDHHGSEPIGGAVPYASTSRIADMRSLVSTAALLTTARKEKLGEI